jgi:AraC-like DNA-binding protein
MIYNVTHNSMSIIADLSRLALSADDNWTKRSDERAVLEYASTVEIDEAEAARVRNMIEECGFTQTTLMSNFDARLDSAIHPPTGYAAIWRSDSIFVADAIDQNIFRHIQGVSISAKRRPNIGPHVVAALNAFLGDASPVPCVSSSQKGNWVCSLGQFAWVGLYDQHAPKPPFAAVVVCGLDPASWNAMQTEMREEWHRKLTMSEVYPRILFWKNVAKQNGERVLATFIRTLNEYTHDASLMNELSMIPPYESRSTQFVSDVSCSSWFKNHPKLRIPKWFVFPSSSPRGCDPQMPAESGFGIKTTHDHTEMVPWTVVPEFSACLDDIVPYGENEYVRMAGCCDARASVRALVRGPTDEILIIETPGEPCPSTLHAFAAQATQQFNSVVDIREEADEDEAVKTTWEDAELSTNRMIHSTYVFRTSQQHTHQNAQRLMPYFVRTSCRDALGKAEISRKSRLACLQMDEWKPIQR